MRSVVEGKFVQMMELADYFLAKMTRIVGIRFRYQPSAMNSILAARCTVTQRSRAKVTTIVELQEKTSGASLMS